MLSMKNITPEAFQNLPKRKLLPKQIGPFKIIQQIGNLAYKLELPHNYKRIHPVFHVSQLQKYQHDPKQLQEPPGPIEITPEDDHIYEVEKIIDKRVTKSGREEWLVKWKGWDLSASTWHSMKDLSGCQDELIEFENRLRSTSN